MGTAPQASLVAGLSRLSMPLGPMMFVSLGIFAYRVCCTSPGIDKGQRRNMDLQNGGCEYIVHFFLFFFVFHVMYVSVRSVSV